MKIFYSNVSSLKDIKKRMPQIGVLISYYGIKKLTVPLFCNSLFLDSGAFSAFTQKVKIKIKSYVNFIHQEKNKINIYASLDDISSYQNSLDNFKIMIKEGLSPLPCFHIGEPFWVLEKYLLKTNYIALGGIAKKKKKTRYEWLSLIFNKYPDTDFHGFGIQDRNILTKFPWKSVDSSSAHVMARFGGICSPWGNLKINPNVNQKDLKWITPKTELVIQKWIKGFKISYKRAIQNDPLGTETRALINILYYEELAKLAEQNFKAVNPNLLGFQL